MSVMIGIASKGDVESILDAKQPLHRIDGGRVHPDLAIPIHRHEAKRGVDLIADDRQVQTITLGNSSPVMHAGTPQWVNAHVNTGAANRLHVNDAAQIIDIGAKKIMPVGGIRMQRLFQRDSDNTIQPGFQQCVGPCFDPASDVGIGRAAVGRVVLETTVVWRIMRGRDDDAVGHTCAPPLVVDQNGMRHGWRRRVFIPFCQHHFDTICCQHFQRAGVGRLRQGMGIDPDEQWAIDAMLLAVLANSLSNGQYMRFIEAARK